MAARPRNLFWYRFCEKKRKASIYNVINFSVISEFRKSSKLQKESSRSFSICHCKKETRKEAEGSVLTQLLLCNSYHENKCKGKPYTTKLSHN